MTKLKSIHLIFLLLPWTASHSQDLNLSIFEITGGVESTFNIRLMYLYVPTPTWPDIVSGKPLVQKDMPEFLRYLKLFNQEFLKYPSAFIKSANLKQVVFLKNLQVYSQDRAATPDYFKETLYLDIYVGNYDTTYQKHVIHHEFYHMIEEEFNGDAYFKDPDWSKLNTAGFQYGSGGAQARTSNMFPLTHPQPGFINLYSMSGLEEDKAEIYAILFLPEEFSKVDEWSRADDILAGKVKYMRDFLLTRSKSAMDEAYWRKVSNSR